MLQRRACSRLSELEKIGEDDEIVVDEDVARLCLKLGELPEFEKKRTVSHRSRKTLLQSRTCSRLSAVEEICEDDSISIDTGFATTAVPNHLAKPKCLRSPASGSNDDFHRMWSLLQSFLAKALPPNEMVLVLGMQL